MITLKTTSSLMSTLIFQTQRGQRLSTKSRSKSRTSYFKTISYFKTCRYLKTMSPIPTRTVTIKIQSSTSRALWNPASADSIDLASNYNMMCVTIVTRAGSCYRGSIRSWRRCARYSRDKCSIHSIRRLISRLL